VLYRQTSFGTFGGGGDANISIPCINICGTSGGNTTPGGNGGIGSPAGPTTVPGGNTAPGGNTTPGGGDDGGGGDGKSVVWSTRRTDPDDTVVSPAPSSAASKSASIAMAADAAKITRITRRR
jgi:hypothetical protein